MAMAGESLADGAVEMNAVCRGASDEHGECRNAALRCMLYSVTSWLDGDWRSLDGPGAVNLTVIDQCWYRTMGSLTLYVRFITDM